MAASALVDQVAPSRSAGASRARSTPAESKRSIRTYRNNRSEYDFDADNTLGRWGSPAPTTMSGAPVWDSSWQLAHSADTS